MQFFLRKNGIHAHPEDILKLQDYLHSGGSLSTTPWGAMDYQARIACTKERAIQNTLRYASFAKATILPVIMDVEWGDTPGKFPVDSVVATIQNPIMPIDGMLNQTLVTSVVSKMYDSYVA